MKINICVIILSMIAVLLMNSGFMPCSAETFSKEISETRLSETPAISDFIIHAYNENPSIQAARNNWKAAVENYRAATGYPDPQIMITYFPQPIETRLGPQDWNINLSQMIPFPGKLSKAGEVAEADARIARLNLDKTVRDITVSILESFYELFYIREAKQIAAQNSELLDHLRKTAETGYAQDRTALVDVVKAQSQTAQLRYDMLLLEELEKTEITRINGLLNRHPDASVGNLGKMNFKPVAYGLEDIYKLAETGQEEIKMAEVQVEKAKAKADLAEYQKMPDFRVGIFYAGIGNPDVSMTPDDAGQDAIGIQFGINIPLWLGKNNGAVESARAQEEKSKAEKDSRIIEIRTNIRNLFFRLQNSQRLITLYRDEMLPQAASAVETAETWFSQGEGSFSDFAETQSAFYNFQLSLARAYADYGKYLARLEKLAGRSLTEKGEK